ncbi:MAG: cyclic nucleotide-binding domain-containing protein [Hyphomicrobiaceae bacterium]
MPPPDDSTAALLDLGIFQDLPPEDRRAMESEFQTVPLKRGEVLVKQGDAASDLYFVVSGRFEVHVRGRDGAIAEIGPGSPVGEIAFLAGGERTATVIAARDSLVLRLGRPEFDRLCARMPDIWRALTATLATRLAETNAGGRTIVEPVPRTVTVIPAGPSHVPERFIELLVAAFGAQRRICIVRALNLEEHIGAGVDPASDAATQRLNALESRFETVLYIADGELTPWSQKAIRQADLVLRVGVAQSETIRPVAQNVVERFADGLVGSRAQRLVLLHDRRRAPVGTKYWLQSRLVQMHHHVALSDAADVERLVRFIQGKALGLVACGGGAFCAAHTGLYKAFLEAGVVFDIMGGTSGGSAMAGAFAMGHAPEDIDRSTHDIFVTNRALRRYTWPRYSILDHTHFDRLLAQQYAGVDIEDLWIPFFAISTNLSRYSLHQHRAGDMWTAVRASGSIPALLPPFYTEDGQMLVDGCLLDNVPIRIMHQIKRGPNVVVAFEVPQLERFSVEYRALPSRNELFAAMLRPFARKPLPEAPSLGSVLLRSLMANRQNFEHHLRRDDLLIVPPLPEDMGILDWSRHAELMQSAYRWCTSELERIAGDGHPALAEARKGRRSAIARTQPRSKSRDQT